MGLTTNLNNKKQINSANILIRYPRGFQLLGAAEGFFAFSISVDNRGLHSSLLEFGSNYLGQGALVEALYCTTIAPAYVRLAGMRPIHACVPLRFIHLNCRLTQNIQLNFLIYGSNQPWCKYAIMPTNLKDCP